MSATTRLENQNLPRTRETVAVKATTDPEGNFHFNRLESGYYFLRFIPPPELVRALARESTAEVAVALAESR